MNLMWCKSKDKAIKPVFKNCVQRKLAFTMKTILLQMRRLEVGYKQVIRMEYPSDEVVRLSTSMGDIFIELYWKHAPRTCKNFYELTRRGYYNNTRFHRMIKNFMIQGGDPTGTGKGGSSIYGPLFEDEFHQDLKHVGAGIISMANSQFILTLGPCQWLDGKNTIFGRVYRGIKNLSKMGMMPTDNNERLEVDIFIESAEIVKAEDI
ncbi:Peptidyl-prolyl cis-trans isomerase-like 1 [Thelohanellus kitauei]|uniref:Peptidyl-prolyl cis-trans isomerase n=1 Tax=Thelohanellus kitauei TaxID=669202 RepID=A0A0C2N872_THEKT|nr:Peptidyl-prolyl cis-trans isomerase-like 1 [Thelohanellus kitauei]